MKQKSQTKRHIHVIMLVAIFAVMLFIIYGINNLFDLRLNSVVLMFLMIMSIFAAAIIHAVYSLGFWRGLAIIGLGGLLGHLFEMLGLEHGMFFGGAYVYEPGYFGIAGVPYFVTVCWGIFVYTSYSVTNAFMRWAGKELPSIKVKQSYFWQIGPLVVMDGVLTTILDLALDPIQVQQGTWVWLGGGNTLVSHSGTSWAGLS